LAWKHGAVHVPEVLGLYYDGGFEAQHRAEVVAESQRVIARLRRRIPLADVYPGLREPEWRDDPGAHAAALVDFGVALRGPAWPDGALALACFEDALARAPGQAGIANDCALGRCVGGAPHEGLEQLARLAAAGDGVAMGNLAALRGATAAGGLRLVTLPHP